MYTIQGIEGTKVNQTREKQCHNYLDVSNDVEPAAKVLLDLLTL